MNKQTCSFIVIFIDYGFLFEFELVDCLVCFLNVYVKFLLEHFDLFTHIQSSSHGPLTWKPLKGVLVARSLLLMLWDFLIQRSLPLIFSSESKLPIYLQLPYLFNLNFK